MKEIVIKLTDNCYKRVVDYKENLPVQILEAIRHGVVLPKGHGRIADMDEAIKCIEEVTDSKEKQYALYLVDWACSKRVLIEADKN